MVCKPARSKSERQKLSKYIEEIGLLSTSFDLHILFPIIANIIDVYETTQYFFKITINI